MFWNTDAGPSLAGFRKGAVQSAVRYFRDRDVLAGR